MKLRTKELSTVSFTLAIAIFCGIWSAKCYGLTVFIKWSSATFSPLPKGMSIFYYGGVRYLIPTFSEGFFLSYQQNLCPWGDNFSSASARFVPFSASGWSYASKLITIKILVLGLWSLIQFSLPLRLLLLLGFLLVYSPCDRVLIWTESATTMFVEISIGNFSFCRISKCHW